MRSTSTRGTTSCGSGSAAAGRRAPEPTTQRPCRGRVDRAARRGGRAYRRARRTPPAVRLARGALDPHPARAPARGRPERRLGHRARDHPHVESAAGPRGARRLLRDLPAARPTLGPAPARGRAAAAGPRPPRDPDARLVRELSRAGEARRPVPELPREAAFQRVAFADRRGRRRRAAPRHLRRLRPADRRWLRRVRPHGDAGPAGRLPLGGRARGLHRRGVLRGLLRRAAGRALLPGGGPAHRPPVPRGGAPFIPRAAGGRARDRGDLARRGRAARVRPRRPGPRAADLRSHLRRRRVIALDDRAAQTRGLRGRRARGARSAGERVRGDRRRGGPLRAASPSADAPKLTPLTAARGLVLLVGALLLFRAASALVVFQPGYTDAYYYADVAQRLAGGQGLTAGFIWNFLEAPFGCAVPAAGPRFLMSLVTLIGSC